MSRTYRVGVLGATGAVGSTILEVLEERNFPVAELVPLASERSAGKRLPFAGDEVEVKALSEESIQGLDVVLSSAGGAVSSEWAPRIVDAQRSDRSCIVTSSMPASLRRGCHGGGGP